MAKRTDRIGERFISNEGCEFIIVEYNRYGDLWVEFQDEYKARVHTDYKACQKGEVKNPYHPSVYGVGCLGEGKYKSKNNGKVTKEYREWQSMLERCYDNKCQERCPTYKDVYVNEYFHNFQNYCKWREDNYYEIEGEQMCLDKDILIKGNKEYSFDTMIFVPQRINKLFTKRDNDRGGYPIGVTYDKRKNIYEARCSINEKHQKFLGYYDTPHEAFLAYKTFKEQYIKQVADEYKGRIPDRLYEAMYAWEVEIDD